MFAFGNIVASGSSSGPGFGDRRPDNQDENESDNDFSGDNDSDTVQETDEGTSDNSDEGASGFDEDGNYTGGGPGDQLSSSDAEDGCGLNPLCHVGEAAGSVAESVLQMIVQNFIDGVTALLSAINTWWFDTPSPDLDNNAVAGLQADLMYMAGIFAVVGFLVALARLVMTQDVNQGLISALSPIVALIVVTGAYMTAIPILRDSFDEFGMWLMQQAGEDGDPVDITVLGTMMASGVLGNVGIGLLIGALMLLGSVVNFLFMILRDLLLLILVAFLPVIAASTGTQTGKQAFGKANAWLIALLLYVPVAAGIYALGIRLIRQDVQITGMDDGVDAMLSAIMGLLVLVLAALSLPALIKFVVPAAAMGASAFSGGAALGAAASVAAGAAVIGATGGAGAAAGGASAAAGGAGGASGAASGGAGAGTGGGASEAAGVGAGGGAGGGASEAASGGAGGGANGATGGASGGESSGGREGQSAGGAGAAGGGESQAASSAGGSGDSDDESSVQQSVSGDDSGGSDGASGSVAGGGSAAQASDSASGAGAGGDGAGGAAGSESNAETSAGGAAEGSAPQADSDSDSEQGSGGSGRGSQIAYGAAAAGSAVEQPIEDQGDEQ